jgi:hypothetical protein
MRVLLDRVSFLSVCILALSAAPARGQAPNLTSVSSTRSAGADLNRKDEKPATSIGDPTPPIKPKREDFATLDAYEAAKDKYYEDLTDYKVRQAVTEAEKRTEAKIRESESAKVREQLLAEREAEKQRADGLERRLAALEGGMKTQSSVATAVKEDAVKDETVQPVATAKPAAPQQDLSWTKGDYKITLFGAIRLDAYFNSARTQGAGLPGFLFPKFAGGFSQQNMSMNARHSMVGLLFRGPDIGKFHSGGRMQAVFFDNTNVFADNNGFMLTQSYGELWNDKWRFAAGLQLDVFAPNLPTSLAFSVDGAPVGNSIKGQLRVEHYLKLGSDSQVTLQGALSEPLNSIKTPDISVDEDVGLPNTEGRIAFGLGKPSQIGLLRERPVEIGLSGVVGKLRRTALPSEPARRVISTTWGVNLDFRANLGSRFGFKGEVYTGQGLGQMVGGVLQSLDAVTWKAIGSTGGWFEGYVYLTPMVHNHTGMFIDDPVNKDITGLSNTLFGRTRNRVFYNTLLWDLGKEKKKFRIGVEFTLGKTEFKDPALTGRLANSGFGIHPQFQWLF